MMLVTNTASAPVDQGPVKYCSTGFKCSWGPCKLEEVYPALHVNSSRAGGGEDMTQPALNPYLDGFDELFVMADEQSQMDFLKLIGEDSHEGIRFLFSPLPSRETKTLTLVTETGPQTIELPTHYQEPPVWTVIKEVHNMGFAPLIKGLQVMIEQLQAAAIIPDDLRRAGEPSAPRSCHGVHIDTEGFAYIGFFDDNGLLTTKDSDKAMVIDMANQDASIVASFQKGRAFGAGVYRDPNSHTLHADFADSMANGAALYITKLWQHVLVGEVVNGAFQNYQSVQQSLAAGSGEPQGSESGELVKCDIGDFVDGTRAIEDTIHLQAIKPLPKRYRNNDENLAAGRQVLQTACGNILGVSQRCASRTIEFEIKNDRLFPRFWPLPTIVSKTLPVAPGELSEKKKASGAKGAQNKL